jgi:hypothetical protein
VPDRVWDRVDGEEVRCATGQSPNRPSAVGRGCACRSRWDLPAARRRTRESTAARTRDRAAGRRSTPTPSRSTRRRDARSRRCRARRRRARSRRRRAARVTRRRRARADSARATRLKTSRVRARAPAPRRSAPSTCRGAFRPGGARPRQAASSLRPGRPPRATPRRRRHRGAPPGSRQVFEHQGRPAVARRTAVHQRHERRANGLDDRAFTLDLAACPRRSPGLDEDGPTAEERYDPLLSVCVPGYDVTPRDGPRSCGLGNLHPERRPAVPDDELWPLAQPPRARPRAACLPSMWR